MEINDLELRRKVESVFNQKKSDINEPAVLAAIITAASNMARCSELVTEEVTVEQLLDLYQKSDDSIIGGLIGMGPQYVKANIGYSVDFNDYANSMAAYNADKQSLDIMYAEILNRSLSKNNDITK